MKLQIGLLLAAFALVCLPVTVQAAAAPSAPAPGNALLAPPARMEITVIAPTPPVVKAKPARVMGGYLAVETPLGSPDRRQDDSTMLLGRLSMSHVLGPVGMFVAGQWQLKSGTSYDGENRVQLGLDYPLSHKLTAYLFGERRFGGSDNRIVAGVRWNFGGK